MVLWKCAGCLSTFKDHVSYEIHGRTCKPLRTKDNRDCQYCGKRFHSGWGARTHEKTCPLSKTNTHKCDRCGKTFTGYPGNWKGKWCYCPTCDQEVNNPVSDPNDPEWW